MNIIKIQSLWRAYTIRSQLWYMRRFKGMHVVGGNTFKDQKCTGTTNYYNTMIHTTSPV